MCDSFLDKRVGDMTGAEFEEVLTRSLCSAFQYGVMRWQMQMNRPFEAQVAPVTDPEARDFIARETEFLSPSDCATCATIKRSGKLRRAPRR